MYINKKTGDKVSVEDMQKYADDSGVSIEEYAVDFGYTLEETAQDTSSADLLDPTTFQTDAAAGADVVSQPMTASQAGYVEPEDTELAPVDTSLDSPDPEPRFIEFKGKGDRLGAIVYEDTYLETKAGQPGYPDTFDEYAAAFNTTPQNSSTEEIAIKATSNEKVFESLVSTPLGISYNKDTGGFDNSSLSDLDNAGLFRQEEEVSKKTFNKLFAGSGIDFEETDYAKEGEKGVMLGTEALRARIKDPETGEYIYSETLELESDGSFMNNDKIEKFLDENRSYLDLPKWTRSKNKMISKYKQWKNNELDPIINKARVEAKQAYIENPDLFKPYDKKINVGGFNTSTTVTETINPYQKEIAQEVNRLQKKGVKGNLEEKAKINVRQNLKQADINEAIRETRAKFINAASNTEEAQAFLYASETFVKQEKAKAYNKNNEGAQISADGANKNNQMQRTVIDVFSATPNANQSVDDFIIQQKNKLQPIIDELNINIPEDTKEKINSPKLNMLLGLDEEVLLPKRFYNIMMALENAKNANISDYNDKRIEMAESIGDISDIDIAMDATAKNYELVEKYAVSAGLGFQDIVVNTGMLGLNVLSLGQSEKVAQLGSDYVEYTKEIRNSYQRDVSFDEAFSTPENTTKFIFQEVSNQLPIFLAMAASGGSAAYVVGASSAGGKMMDMQNEIATGTAEYSPLKLWGTSLGYGLAEGLFAQVTTVPILRRAKLNWMNNGKESIVNNSMKEYAKTQYKGLIYEPILEASGEVATVGVQNLLDGNPFMQGMDHAGTSGLAFGFAFAAIPFLKGMYNSQFSTYETRGEIRTMQKELDGLQQELNMSLLNTPTTGINFFKGKQDLLKQSIEEKSIQLADKIKQQEVIVANNLTEGSKNEVVKIINKQARLERLAIEIQENPNISDKERGQLIAEIKSEYDAVVKARNEAVKDETMLKNGTEWAAFKGLNRSKSQEYLDTADAMLSGERNGKQASKEDINDRAYDLYFGDKIRVENKKLGRSNSSLFKNFKSFETVDEAIKEVNNDDTIAAEDKKETIQALKNGYDGYWNPASDTMVAIVENQVKNQRKYTKTHEVGHKAFEMLLGNPKNNAAFKGISDQLLSTLKATDRKTYDKFIKDGIDDDAGNIDPTEVISRFMEYVADDKITNVQKAKGISGLFGVMIQKTFGSDYKFDFRGERDIFNFVVGFGKKLKDGTLTTADIKKAKESKVIKDLPTSDITTDTDREVSFSKASLQTELNTLKENEFDYDPEQFQSLVSNLETKIRIAGKKEAAKPKTTEFDTSEKSTIGQINNLVPKDITTNKEYKENKKVQNEIDKAFKPNGIISNIIKGRFGGGDLFIETLNSVKNRAVRYDPAAERKKAGNNDPVTFAEFIFSNVNFSKLDAAKKLAIKAADQKKKTDLDNKEAQGKTTEEDSGPTADTRKKYKPLISNPKLIPSFISSEIKTKLANVVSKLTSKLSTRPKGKNAQTTPLIAEIKKAIGNVVKDPKALPKQLIARMGNPKDGSYQTYLIDNKKSILENMTTTYLQSAIPQAVEKSVGGAYVLDSEGKRKKDSNGNDIFKPKFVPYPEWVGKEIDREKVSTNKKGGTSGNQIVRRVIQKEVDGEFEDSITDKDFIANFVGSDGKVIRGKRESLGKALAEEAGFEVFTSELKNDKTITQKDLDKDVIGKFKNKKVGDFVSDVRQAFEGNQEALGEVLADNLVEQVTRDIERGTVKFSKGKYTPTQVQEVLSDLIKVAVQRGANSSEFEIIKNEYPEDIVKLGEELGLYSYFDEGKTGFKAPLKEFEVDEVFKKFFDKYFSTITNKNEETSMKQLADFSEAFIEVLPPEVLAAFPDDMFGIQYGYLDGGAKKADGSVGKYNWLANKKRDKQKNKSKSKLTLPFDPKGVEIFNAGYGLMNQIATVLNQEFPTAEAKRQAVIEKFGDRLDAANANNLAALDYLIQEATKIIAKNPSLIPGFLRWMESSTSNAKAQRGLTTLDLIEYRAESQKVGKEHPLYNRALKFAKERAEISYNKKSKKFKSETSLSDFTKNYLANPRTGVESYLRFKGEHVTPAANVMVELAKNAVNAAASIIKNPIGEPQILTALSIKNTLDLANYSQTLGAKIFSDFQDVGSIAESIKGLGTTSKLGDFRGLALDSKDLNAFFSHDGVRAINYIQRKLISLESINKLYNKLDIDKIVSIKTEQKAIDNGRSVSFSKSTKKIRVFDFDDTLARTKSNVLYTMPGEVRVFHGGDIKSVKDIDGFVYFSEDQKQAAAYAKGNQGDVSSFKIDETSIAIEDQVFDVINALGIKPRAGYAVDESSLYELIDPRFEQSFSKKDLEKLAVALKRKGIKAARFTDTNISQGKNEGRETENIVVFDKKTVQEQNKLTAAEFAAKSDELAAEGADFDFIEFSKVMNGQEGPLLKVAKIIAEARGTDDLFVLTARPQDAAGPIQDFLAELGLDIPLENITGLADGNPKAKADWMVGKVAEGYNDFYFADDHLGNVKAVKDVFNTFDVKGKVQQAKVKFSKGLDKGFNDMIERQTGTESFKEFSKGVAQRRGKKVGKFKIFVSPSAEDFRGLTQYKFAGKGKQGEADQKFFEEALMDPYFKGVAAVEAARETIKNDTKALFKIFKPVKKKLNKLVPGIDFTYDGAVRVYLWNKAGIEIPGLTKRDNKKLNDAIANDPELSAFADALLLVSKQDAWPAPTEYWEAKTTLSDLNTLTEKTNRKEYLTEFIENVDIIFSEKNLNKVEALYGKASRVAIENAIYAMKTGSNSPNQSGDGITNRWLQWVNNSIGTIMFFNRRSALLQLTSATNFLNWSDNNPAKAALAFANQPQYWKDWAMIFNSDKLKQRRSGLKSDVQESEIANAAKNTEDKIGSIIAYLLKIGFSPTQIADSIAISSGGATFYRNRVNSLKKKGMSVAEAEAKAFEDFSKLSDEAQQSGDPALVSQQQRSVAGRLILSFQNTTMQYTRLMKKAGQDLINGRGDAKTHMSKILYYGALQNFIFNGLSQTAFALIPGFDDDEDEDQVKRDEKLEEKASRVLNGMTDSIIRGTGIYGAVVTTIKNTYKTWEREADKGFKGDQAKTILEAANISPAIGSKLRKIYSAIQAYQFDKAVMEKHPWSVTIDGKFNPSATYSVIGNLASATLNIPLDRALAEARGVAEMFDNRNSEMQRIALALGWRTWNVGADNEEFDLIKMEAKQQEKEENKVKNKEKRAQKKKEEDDFYKKVGKTLTKEEKRTFFAYRNKTGRRAYLDKLAKQKGIK